MHNCTKKTEFMDGLQLFITQVFQKKNAIRLIGHKFTFHVVSRNKYYQKMGNTVTSIKHGYPAINDIELTLFNVHHDKKKDLDLPQKYFISYNI